MKVALALLPLLTLALATPTATATFTSTSTGIVIPAHIATLPTADILVAFDSTQPVLNTLAATRFATREAKLDALHQALTRHANTAQAQAAALLTTHRVSFTTFWINNQLHVPHADQALIQQLAALPNVRTIRLNEQIPLAPTQLVVSPIEAAIDTFDTRLPQHPNDNNVLAEWGIENIHANVVWSLPGGSDGTGVRVCTIDTGARGTHEALQHTFLGEYGWYDPGAKTPAPNDSNGHGTHTTGTIAGRNGIGVAPGAKWQACKGCASNSCSNADLIGCGQWVACPTLTDGVSAPNCALAPHVVSNSWAGGSGDPWFDGVISAWREGNITPVFANGNLGSGCSSAQSPADSRVGVIAVGATTSANGLAVFSSRGPSAFNTLKPDISGPGQDVRSAFSSADNSYATMSGTSMACPHVAGVVVLLKGIRPSLTFEQIEALLYSHADSNVTPTNQGCGGVVDTNYPNHSFGHGKVNALRSARALLQQLTY